MSRNNPFGNNDDDDDDFGFGNRNAPSYSRDDSNELKRLQERIGQVENDSVESTQRALRSLNEAQETGTKTAEELVRQGEQLNNIDQKLDDVDQTLTATQKNINQIKSIFGGIKNKFMGSGSKSAQSTEKFNKDRQINEKKITRTLAETSSKSANKISQKPEFETITGSDREKELNGNLDAMSAGLKNLNSLALDMKFELDRQNPLIERITDKSERTHNKIDAQDKQMARIK